MQSDHTDTWANGDRQAQLTREAPSDVLPAPAINRIKYMRSLSARDTANKQARDTPHTLRILHGQKPDRAPDPNTDQQKVDQHDPLPGTLDSTLPAGAREHVPHQAPHAHT